MKITNILCFGDSNTWGYDPVNAKRYDRDVRWPGVLARTLGSDCHVVEEGLCGRTTVWDDPVEGDKSGARHLLPLLHSHAPLGLVVIALGVNDLKARFGVGPDDIALGLCRLVDIIRKSEAGFTGPPPEPLVVCPPPLGDMSKGSFGEMFAGAEAKSKALWAAVQKRCIENDIRCVNAAEWIEVSPADGLHLTAEAHQKLGGGLAQVIAESLR